MRFSVHDLREFSWNTAKDRAIAIVNANHEKALILVGHGDSTGAIACGATAQMIPENDDLEVLWVYACNSAKKIASDLAKRGLTTFGFITEVIVPAQGSLSEIEVAQDCIAQVQQIDSADLYCRLRRGLLEFAKTSFRRKDLFEAARVNHTRLSLRVFLPTEDNV